MSSENATVSLNKVIILCGAMFVLFMIIGYALLKHENQAVRGIVTLSIWGEARGVAARCFEAAKRDGIDAENCIYEQIHEKKYPNVANLSIDGEQP